MPISGALPSCTPPTIQPTINEDAPPRLAFVRILPHDPLSAREALCPDAAWIMACYRVTPRIERIGTWRALLDLGRCTDAEASAVVDVFLDWLTTGAGLRARIGVGSSGIVAQLAALTCTAQRPVRLIASANTTAFLRGMPVRVLLHLHPRKELVPTEIVERLQRYGLRTLGHIARLDELTLRRQFGSVGSFLALTAQGRDMRPLDPLPPPAQLRVHLRFAAPLMANEMIALMPHVAGRLTTLLHQQSRAIRSLRLGVRWESGQLTWSRLTFLRQHTDRSTQLAYELRRLLVSLFAPHAFHASHASRVFPAAPLSRDECETSACEGTGARIVDSRGGIEQVWVTLGEFAPTGPVQTTFWRTRQQRLSTVEDIAQTLARRHSHPLLLHLRGIAPEAIFSEDRYTLLSDPHADFQDGPRLSPTGTEPIGGGGGTSRRSRTAAVDAAEAWRSVPQRLHWW